MKIVKIIDGVKCAQCIKCREWFPRTREYFNWSDKKRGYFSGQCLSCNKEYSKVYHKKYREKNRAKLLRKGKEYRKNNKDKIKEYREKNKEKIKKQRKEYREKNKEKIEQYRKENRERLLEQMRQYNHEHAEDKKDHYVKNREDKKKYSAIYYKLRASFMIYAHQLTIEEDPKEGKDGKILVKCAYCGKYFYPTIITTQSRTRALFGKLAGEHRLYCSDGCKKACPIYNQKKWPKGFKPATSREVDPLIRKMCLARDKYTCQLCEKTINEVELHCHHIEGAAQQPMLSNDIENTITLCKPCHVLIHQQNGCTNYDLRCTK